MEDCTYLSTIQIFDEKFNVLERVLGFWCVGVLYKDLLYPECGPQFTGILQKKNNQSAQEHKVWEQKDAITIDVKVLRVGAELVLNKVQ